MKISVLATCITMLVAVTEASAEPLLDQQLAIPGSFSAAIGQCCTHLGQTFTAGITGDLVAVGALISHGTDLTLEIYAVDNLGRPTGAALSTGTVVGDGALLLTPGPSPRVTLSQPVAVIRGRKYALVASIPGESGLGGKIGRASCRERV